MGGVMDHDVDHCCSIEHVHRGSGFPERSGTFPMEAMRRKLDRVSLKPLKPILPVRIMLSVYRWLRKNYGHLF